MEKNPIAVALSEEQQRAIVTLAGGRIVSVCGQRVGAKVSVDFLACNAPFITCSAHFDEGDTGCNAPFAACSVQSNAWNIAFAPGTARIEEEKE
jgi:hypothetical protein